jgi:hypothetical protein
MTTLDVNHSIYAYIEVSDTGLSKIWVHMTQHEFEKLQVEYKTSQNEVQIEMRVGYKTLGGEVFDALSGEFTLHVTGIVKDTEETHRCADVTLEKKTLISDEKMVFAKDWDSSMGEQYWSKTIQGVLDVKQSDYTVECDIVRILQVYDEDEARYVDWSGEFEDILKTEAGHQLSSSIYLDDWGTLYINFSQKDVTSLTAKFTDDNDLAAVKIRVMAYVIGSTTNGPEALESDLAITEFKIELVNSDTSESCATHQIGKTETLSDLSVR